MVSIHLRKSNISLLIWAIIVLFIILEPDYFSHLEYVHFFYRLAKPVISIVVVLYFIMRKEKPNLLLSILIIFETALLFSTIVNDASYADWFRKGAYIIVLFLFIQTMMNANAGILLKALTIVLGVYVHINLITRLVFPEGLFVAENEGYTNCWFLGYDNLAATTIILAETISLFRIFSNPRKAMVWDKTVIVSGVAFPIICEMGTAVLTQVVFFLFLIFMRMQGIRNFKMLAKSIVIAEFVLFFLIQFVNVQQGAFISFIFSLLGKTTTFTGRTRIWQIAWRDLFAGKIILGVGVKDGLSNMVHFGGKWTGHLHCYYLQIFYEGGIIAFSLLFLVLIIAAVAYDKESHSYAGQAIVGGLISFMLMWQVEAYSMITYYFIIIVYLLANTSKLESTVLQHSEI